MPHGDEGEEVLCCAWKEWRRPGHEIAWVCWIKGPNQFNSFKIESTLVVSSAFEGVGQSEYCPSPSHPLHCVWRSKPSNWLRPPWEPCTTGTSLCDWPKRLDLGDVLSEIFFSRPSRFPLWNPSRPFPPWPYGGGMTLIARLWIGSSCSKVEEEEGQRKTRRPAIALMSLKSGLSQSVSLALPLFVISTAVF